MIMLHLNSLIILQYFLYVQGMKDVSVAQKKKKKSSEKESQPKSLHKVQMQLAGSWGWICRQEKSNTLEYIDTSEESSQRWQV